MPLAYRGLGELFVILFFGVVAVIMGVAVGCLSAVLIAINNLRDVDGGMWSETLV